MGVLVREQVTARHVVGPFSEITAGHGILRAAVMLQPNRALTGTQRQQEIVVIVMLRPEKFHCLDDQVAMGLKLLLGGGKLLGLVADDVKADARRQRLDTEIAPRENGTVHERIERYGFEPEGGAL